MLDHSRPSGLICHSGHLGGHSSPFSGPTPYTDHLTRPLDAGPETIGWHLEQRHQIVVSRATIARLLTKAGFVTPEPKKRPKSSYIRFEAAMPNQTWQSDFTHYPLTDTAAFPKGIEIITWLDDCTRYALHISAHRAITTPIVKTTFKKTAGQHGIPASTLTDIQSGWATNPIVLVDGPE